MKISICITGSEVVNGFIQDTNSNFFASQLYNLGYTVREIRTVRDDGFEIQKAWQEFRGRGDFIINSGGLGPTPDDLTVDLICQWLSCESEIYLPALQRLTKYFQSKHSALDAEEFEKRLEKDSSFVLAQRQTRYPKEAKVLENQAGIAPGFLLPKIPLVALPGFPTEIQGMWPQVLQSLKDFPLEKKQTSVVTVWGLGESDVFSCLPKAPPEIEIGVHAKPLGCRIFLKEKETSQQAKESLQGYSKNIQKTFEQSFSKQDPFTDLFDYFQQKKLYISMAESCTGGLAAKMLTDVAGASAIFRGSVVSYANEIKEKVLNVSKEVLQQQGAVSAECARQMAEGVLQLNKSDVAFSLTGIAGPSGGTLQKPVGTFFLGLAFSSHLCEEFSLPISLTAKFYYPYGRERFRLLASQKAYLSLWSLFCKLNGNYVNWKNSNWGKDFC